jgi:hypothetical protein|tara:strand:+ start:5370 stop:5891 length:522 start_codon:yes stop_codon:yes gene_type:complete
MINNNNNMGIVPLANEQNLGILPERGPVELPSPFEIGKNIAKQKALETIGRKVGLPALGQVLGMNSLYSNPFGLALLGPVGLGIAALGGGIRDRFMNYRQAKETKKAIQRESVSDLQGRIDKGEFGSNTPTPQDDRRGGQYSGGSQGGGRSNAARNAGTEAARGGGFGGRLHG